jgi:hypothetical protein
MARLSGSGGEPGSRMTIAVYVVPVALIRSGP